MKFLEKHESGMAQDMHFGARYWGMMSRDKRSHILLKRGPSISRSRC